MSDFTARRIKHVQRRARERYGCDMPDSTYWYLCRRIRNGRGKFLGWVSENSQLWRLKMGRVYWYAIYNLRHSEIVTVLTEEQVASMTYIYRREPGED